MSTAQIPSTRIIDRNRRLNGITPATKRPWQQRVVRDPLFWLTAVLIPFYVFCLVDQFNMLHPDQEFPDGTVALGLNWQSLRFGAYWAMWTALVWVALFLFLDRYRRRNPLIWLLTFGWGACASTWMSLHINTWAGQTMNTTDANADTGARAAVFIAPFSEEATKATVLFLLVILFRTRLIHRLSILVLAGLSALGFAFVENIIYYARGYVYAHHTHGIEDPMAEVMDLVKLRGLYTSFGHPTFTIMIAFGLMVALGARSKIVRVMAPLAGFLMAAMGHMLFNGMASLNPVEALRPAWYFALVLVLLIVVYCVLSVIGEGQLIRRRLDDLVKAGWLSPRDPIVYSSIRRRFKLHVAGMFRGPRKYWRTRRFMHNMTEVAQLRDGLTRGVLDDAAEDRVRDLLRELDQQRDDALTDTEGLRWIPKYNWRWRRTKAATSPPPNYPGPAGLGGNWPAPDPASRQVPPPAAPAGWR